MKTNNPFGQESQLGRKVLPPLQLKSMVHMLGTIWMAQFKKLHKLSTESHQK